MFAGVPAYAASVAFLVIYQYTFNRMVVLQRSKLAHCHAGFAPDTEVGKNIGKIFRFVNRFYTEIKPRAYPRTFGIFTGAEVVYIRKRTVPDGADIP